MPSITAATLDLRLLTYLSPTDSLQCPICHAPLVDPVTTPCRHTFCSTCLHSALTHHPECPIDRLPLLADTLEKSPIMITNMVNELEIECPNAANGCSYTGARCRIAGHLEECEGVEVECVCGQLVLRSRWREECVHELVKCSSCEKEVERVGIDEHMSECPNLETECPHCAANLLRSALKSHLETCPSFPTSCPAASIGCLYTGPRSQLSSHTTTCALIPLTPLLSSLTSRIATLELENRTLKHKLHALSDVPPRDEYELHTVLADQDRQRQDMDRLCAAMRDLEGRQTVTVLHVNDYLRTREEVAVMGAEVVRLGGRVQRLEGVVHKPAVKRSVGAVGRGEFEKGTGGMMADSRVGAGDRVKL